MKTMVSNAKKTASIILAISMIIALMIPFATHASAGIPSNMAPIKAYTISTGRVTTYVNPNGAVSGYIDGATDLCTIVQVLDNGWVWVEYPVSQGTKRAYAKLSDFVSDPNFTSYKVNLSKTMTVYRRSDLKQTHGEAWTTDTVWAISTSGNKTQIIYNISGGWKLGWINATFTNSGTSTSATSFSPVWPTDGGSITAADTYPSSGKPHSFRYSHGIDIGVKSGTNVYATEAGTVITVKDLGNSSFGKYIIIKHSNGAESLYAHLSVQSVSVGDSVSRGQIIGKSGNTGNSSGAHLHFEISTSTKNRLADYFPGK